jgi:hypothetical protein
MHALQPRDPLSWVHVCSWFLQSIAEGEADPQLTFFPDEARFRSQGYVNVQNTRYWSSQIPRSPPPSSESWCQFNLVEIYSATWRLNRMTDGRVLYG